MRVDFGEICERDAHVVQHRFVILDNEGGIDQFYLFKFALVHAEVFPLPIQLAPFLGLEEMFDVVF